MTTRLSRVLLLAALLSVPVLFHADPLGALASGTHTCDSRECEIRESRKAYNAAIAARDADAIGQFWRADARSIWADDRLTIGRDAIIARYRKAFVDRAFQSGVRHTEFVEVDTTAGNLDAAEVGTWQWTVRVNGEDIVWRGRYLATWRNVDGKWLLRSDLYAETGCSGGRACN